MTNTWLSKGVTPKFVSPGSATWQRRSLNRLRSSRVTSTSLFAFAASTAVISLSACSSTRAQAQGRRNREAGRGGRAAPARRGTADCNHNRGNACEATLNTEAANCGACGNTCAAGQRVGGL